MVGARVVRVVRSVTRCSTLVGAWLVSAQSALAERPQLACPDVLLIETHPARTEWAAWLTGGLASPRRANGRWLAGAGAEATFQALRYHGFPGLAEFKQGDGELRWGPWVLAGYRDPGAWGEGGLKVHAGAVRSQAFGTFDVRVGLGYGAFELGAQAHYTGSLGWGIRTAIGRQQGRGYCDPPARPLSATEASIFRLLFTQRGSLSDTRGLEWTLTLELSPTFFAPPVVCKHFVVH
jgi:hypothetical protein